MLHANFCRVCNQTNGTYTQKHKENHSLESSKQHCKQFTMTNEKETNKFSERFFHHESTVTSTLVRRVTTTQCKLVAYC